jgi:hypothetical protein
MPTEQSTKEIRVFLAFYRGFSPNISLNTEGGTGGGVKGERPSVRQVMRKKSIFSAMSAEIIWSTTPLFRGWEDITDAEIIWSRVIHFGPPHGF